jgi:hypothetical protein
VRARAGARGTRTNIEAAVQRALSEPGHPGDGFGTGAAAGVLANMRRLADGASAPAETLRHAHEQLSQAAGPTVPLVTETDRMVDSALLAADVLRRAADARANSVSGASVTSAAPAVSSG